MYTFSALVCDPCINTHLICDIESHAHTSQNMHNIYAYSTTDYYA